MKSSVTNVLWTSGWDSTFRVASLLLLEGRVVQPYYVWHTSRKSAKTELKTMEKIRFALERKDPAVKDLLRETIVVKISDIPESDETVKQYNLLRQQRFLGTQIMWLSRMAQWKGIQLELGVHRDDSAHAFLEGNLVPTSDGSYQLREGVDEGLRIYAPFSFPLFDITKVEMQKSSQEHGFSDIMEMTWFCHNPLLDGSPCGICNPCKYTKEEGLGRRIPPVTRFRLFQAKLLNFIWLPRSAVFWVQRSYKKKIKKSHLG